LWRQCLCRAFALTETPEDAEDLPDEVGPPLFHNFRISSDEIEENHSAVRVVHILVANGPVLPYENDQQQDLPLARQSYGGLFFPVRFGGVEENRSSLEYFQIAVDIRAVCGAECAEFQRDERMNHIANRKAENRRVKSGPRP
jgi:hypothetical protein